MSALGVGHAQHVNGRPHWLVQDASWQRYPAFQDPVLGGPRGNDVIRLNTPFDDIDLIAGDDRVVSAGGGDDIVYGQRGNDNMYACEDEMEMRCEKMPAPSRWQQKGEGGEARERREHVCRLGRMRGSAATFIILRKNTNNYLFLSYLALTRLSCFISRSNGGGGDDEIFGMLGNDILAGGDGHDYIFGDLAHVMRATDGGGMWPQYVRGCQGPDTVLVLQSTLLP